MRTLAKEQSSKIPAKRLQAMLDCAMALPVTTVQPKKHLNSSDLWDDPEIDDFNEAVTAAGYTLHPFHLRQDEEDWSEPVYHVGEFSFTLELFVTICSWANTSAEQRQGAASLLLSSGRSSTRRSMS